MFHSDTSVPPVLPGSVHAEHQPERRGIAVSARIPPSCKCESALNCRHSTSKIKSWFVMQKVDTDFFIAELRQNEKAA